MASFASCGTEFPIGYCELCQTDILYCPKCGNNTCNGGYGLIDGVECDLCPAAYDAASEFYSQEKIKWA